MDVPSRPGFGRTKHELLPPEAQPQAFPNDRSYYKLLGFLTKRRGGGGGSSFSSSGGSKSSGGSSSGSSSPSRGSSGSTSSGKSGTWRPWSEPAELKSPSSSLGSASSLGDWRPWSKPKPSAPKSDSSSGSSPSGSKPSTPKSGSWTGGSSPSKPKSPALAPPKAPKLPKIPKLPKPKPGWKPPKGSLPGYTPGHPPHHGSGGHSPVIGGGHGHENNHASPARSCIHPKGMDRLRCEKADAVIGTLFAVIALLLVPFLIYLCFMYCKRRKSARRNKDEEDGLELTRGGMDGYSDPQTDRGVPDGASNIGLAVTTSQESVTLTKDQTQDRSSGSSPGRKPPPAYHRSTSLSRGRKRSRSQHSPRSVSRSFSSGMIRTARLGQALQDAKVIELPPSLAGSRRESERRYSSSDNYRSCNSNPREYDEQRCSEEEGRDFADEGEEGDERRSRCSSHRSCSRLSEQQKEEEGRPDDSGSRCSSRKSSLHDLNERPEEERNESGGF